MVWENLLVPIGFPGKTSVRISVADWWEHETCTYSDDSLYVTKSDSLISYYLGYCCEIGVTGYLHCPWWRVFTPIDKVLLCIIVLCCFLLFFIQEYVVRIYRRFFVKEVPVIVEKEIPVIAMEKSQTHIYQLEDDLYFDADSGELSRTDACVKLSSLPAKLLQGFLEAENYLLSINEIMALLWQDGTGTSERVHTTITRLRKELSKIPNWEITNGNSSYRLKTPHSIEEIQS
ncbi:MAG: winged helix-turn-helix domain-containing protein [Bacteroides sp.]|nr:winged helix-turn-helix domain-containing protein [Bacteroides sp.]